MAYSDASKLYGGEVLSVPHVAAEQLVFLAEDSAHTHLLTDMDLELTWISAELSRMNTRLSEIEAQYNKHAFKKKTKKRNRAYLRKIRDEEEAKLRVTALMDLHRHQSNRMETFKLLYSYANVFNYNSVLSSHLRQILFPGDLLKQNKSDVKEGSRKLAQALHHYCLDGPSDEADDEIRFAINELSPFYDDEAECCVC